MIGVRSKHLFGLEIISQVPEHSRIKIISLLTLVNGECVKTLSLTDG